MVSVLLFKCWNVLIFDFELIFEFLKGFTFSFQIRFHCIQAFLEFLYLLTLFFIDIFRILNIYEWLHQFKHKAIFNYWSLRS